MVSKDLKPHKRFSYPLLQIFLPPLGDFELIVEDLRKRLETPDIELPMENIKLDQNKNTFHGHRMIKYLNKGAFGMTFKSCKVVDDKENAVFRVVKVVQK